MGRHILKFSTVIEKDSRVIPSVYYRTENDKVYTYINGNDSLYIDFNNKDISKGYYTEVKDSLVTSFGTLRNVLCVKQGNQNSLIRINYYAKNIGFVGDDVEPVTPDMDYVGLIYAKLGDKVYK